MRLLRQTGDKLRKLTRLAICVNALQIICALGLFLRVLLSKSFTIPENAELTFVGVVCAVVIWGAFVDIRDALVTRNVEQQRQMLTEAYAQLEELNQTLRRQRHDFKNHLQVIYSLTEMSAYGDAKDYIQRIYEDVQSVGKLIRTAVPAVNALICAKSADCEEHGIRFDVDFQSAWDEMPVAGWELCRIIGNLVDNAMDALREGETSEPSIRILIGENIDSFLLNIENNGPEIAAEHRQKIFLPGFTSKSSGHGYGLSIVTELIRKYSGTLKLESNSARTCFCCTFPKLRT